MELGNIELKWESNNSSAIYTVVVSEKSFSAEDYRSIEVPTVKRVLVGKNSEEATIRDLEVGKEYYLRVIAEYEGLKSYSEEIKVTVGSSVLAGPYKWLKDSPYSDLGLRDIRDSGRVNSRTTFPRPEFVSQTDFPLDTWIPVNKTEAYGGATLADNGFIYCAPAKTGSVLKLNEDYELGTNTQSEIEILPYSYTYSSLYSNVICAQNGKLYFIPDTADKVLVVDPQNDDEFYYIEEEVEVGATLKKWFGATLHPDGKIYCAPYYSETMLVIDTSNDTVELLEGFASGVTWAGACLAPNGNIFFAPEQGGLVLEFNPTTGDKTYHVVSGNYRGICPSPDGSIYMSRFSESGPLAVIRFEEGDVSIDYIPMEDGQRFSGANLSPDGCIILSPFSDDEPIVVVRDGKVVETLRTLMFKYATSGGVIDFEGKYFSAPRRVNNILEASSASIASFYTYERGGPYTWATSRYFNKSF